MTQTKLVTSFITQSCCHIKIQPADLRAPCQNESTRLYSILGPRATRIEARRLVSFTFFWTHHGPAVARFFGLGIEGPNCPSKHKRSEVGKVISGHIWSHRKKFRHHRKVLSLIFLISSKSTGFLVSAKTIPTPLQGLSCSSKLRVKDCAHYGSGSRFRFRGLAKLLCVR